MFLQDEGTQMPADDTQHTAGADDNMGSDMNSEAGSDQAAEGGMDNAGGDNA